jgi:hypothetical protein
MDLSLFVSESGLAEFERIRAQKRSLINQMPKAKYRKLLQDNIDLPIDKLAEIYTAIAKDYIVCDGWGYDFTTRSGRIKKECKFATLTERNQVSHYTKMDGTEKVYNNLLKRAAISNLSSKNCDLVILIDMGDYLKYFEIPLPVWKSKWKGDSATLTFGARGKWWQNYEVPKEKFFSGDLLWQ